MINRPRRARWLVAATAILSALVIASCDAKSNTIAWTLTYATPEVAAATRAIQVSVLSGGCDGTDSIYASDFRPGTPVSSPSTFAPGRYGFTGVARDANCQLIASGCVEATFPANQRQQIQITLSPDTPRFDCGALACNDGLCVIPTTPDGTTDAVIAADGNVGNDASQGTQLPDGSTPGATCQPALCPGRRCVADQCAYFASCNELHGADPAPSAVYTIDADGNGPSAPFQTYCEMASSGGGWTLLMKMQGADSANAFDYDAPIWIDDAPLNPDKPDLDTASAKFPGYGTLAFSKLRVGLRSTSGTITWLVLSPSGAPFPSLKAVFSAGAFLPTSNGAAQWQALQPSPTLQPNCNREGINAQSDTGNTRVRIGIITNDDSGCASTDALLGFGFHPRGTTCTTTPPTIWTGSYDMCTTGGPTVVPATGYIMVR